MQCERLHSVCVVRGYEGRTCEVAAQPHAPAVAGQPGLGDHAGHHVLQQQQPHECAHAQPALPELVVIGVGTARRRLLDRLERHHIAQLQLAGARREGGRLRGRRRSCAPARPWPTRRGLHRLLPARRRKSARSSSHGCAARQRLPECVPRSSYKVVVWPRVPSDHLSHSPHQYFERRCQALQRLVSWSRSVNEGPAR